MPQGEGTYGNQVGRPSNKRTSFVNDNNWWSKLTNYDFGQSRKEKYVGPGTGSMITTPSSRRGYAKDGSPRVKISERNTYSKVLQPFEESIAPTKDEINNHF